jgi:hypothetical protein
MVPTYSISKEENDTINDESEVVVRKKGDTSEWIE